MLDVVGGGGECGQHRGLVGTVVQLQRLDGLGAVGDRDDRARRTPRPGAATPASGTRYMAAGPRATGGVQHLDLGPQRTATRRPDHMPACGSAPGVGEGPGGGGFGAGELAVEVAGLGAGLGEGVDVGLLGGGAAGLDVAFGDDVVGAAGDVE